MRRYGIQRLVRDLWGIGGTVELDPAGQVVRIILNQANRLAHHYLAALQALVGTENLVIILGET